MSSDEGGLYIPEIDLDGDVLSAAFLYAKAGFYLGPVRPDTKSPQGLGQGWETKTTRDPRVLTGWLAGASPGWGVGIHLGRSGALGIDLDHPDKVPDYLGNACATTVFQESRPDEPGHGHCLFALPPGRVFGNSVGTLGAGWGEVRGTNGFIVVSPSPHKEGGRYKWVRTGPLAVLPAEIADRLPEGSDAVGAATDAGVRAFLAEFTRSSRPELLGMLCGSFLNAVERGESRHQAMLSRLIGAMKEARAGFYDAGVAAENLESLFLTAVASNPVGKQGASRKGAAAASEWAGLLSYAVGQARAADLDAVRARVETHAPDLASLLGATMSVVATVAPAPAALDVDEAGTGPLANPTEPVTDDAVRASPSAAPDVEALGGSGVAPENGAALLDDVEEFLARFIVFPSRDTLIATALWVVHTHALMAFENSPRLAFLSPEPGSGKTRAMEILELLTPRPLLTVNVTPAYLFRKVADKVGPPTILFDEIDTVFGPRAKENEEIRGMLNAGYRRGATAGRCVLRGKIVETEELPAFAAVALAGLDDLPDTIMTRAVVIRMRRRAPGEKVSPYRRRVHGSEGDRLRERIAAWAASVFGDLAEAWPGLPEGVEDRNADLWEPLLAIADAAGDAWPERARVAAVSLVTQAREKQGGFGVQLLADLRGIFGEETKMATDLVLAKLHALPESAWLDLRGKPLDARGLARRLDKFGIKPKVIRLDDQHTARGYDREDMHDAWVRYLPARDEPPDDGQNGSAPTVYEIPPRGIKGQGQMSAPFSSLAGVTSETSATDLNPPACDVCGNPLHHLLVEAELARHEGCQP